MFSSIRRKFLQGSNSWLKRWVSVSQSDGSSILEPLAISRCLTSRGLAVWCQKSHASKLWAGFCPARSTNHHDAKGKTLIWQFHISSDEDRNITSDAVTQGSGRATCKTCSDAVVPLGRFIARSKRLTSMSKLCRYCTYNVYAGKRKRNGLYERNTSDPADE